jgi:methionyl-tRNA formyltransferase
VEDIEALCAHYGVPFEVVPSLNSPETEGAFRAAGADLGLSLGNSYISPRIFEIPEKGMINLHGEILPEYRGAQSVLWPIHDGSDQTGFTIHRIDSTIDGGDILYQVRNRIRFHPTLRETVVRGTPRGPEVAAAVRLACEEFDRLAAAATPQGPGRSLTTPTLRQFLRMVRNHRRMYRESRRTPPAV